MGKLKHGLHGIPEYWIWMGIRRRTIFLKPDSPEAKWYKDVKLYPEWATSFKAFYDYVGSRPSSVHQIDRWPNPNGNYEPGNVRWATPSEQSKNRRNSRLITYKGRTQNLIDWAAEAGIPDTMVIQRLKRGWVFADALNPNRKRGKKLTLREVEAIKSRPAESSRKLAKEFGVCFQMICRIRNGEAWAVL